MFRIVDLSQDIYSGMEVYLGDPKVKIEDIHTIQKEGWKLKLLSMGSHTGTHVDAFSHMDEKGETLDKMPLERFFGKARMVKIESNFPKGSGLLFDEKLELELLEKIYAAQPNFVGFSENCDFEVEFEKQLLKHQIPTSGPLVNLEKLPRDYDFMFYAFPLKIRDGDGSPVRAVAILED